MIQLRSRQVVLKSDPLSVGRSFIRDEGLQRSVGRYFTEVEKEIVVGSSTSSSPALSKLQLESLKKQKGSLGKKKGKRQARRQRLRNAKSVLNASCRESIVHSTLVTHSSLRGRIVKGRRKRVRFEPSLQDPLVENSTDKKIHCTRSLSTGKLVNDNSSEPIVCSELVVVPPTSLTNKAVKRRMGRAPVERSLKGLGVENRADGRNHCTRSSSSKLKVGPSAPTGYSELVVSNICLKGKAVKLRLRRARSEPSLKGTELESRADERKRYSRSSSVEQVLKAPPSKLGGCIQLVEVPTFLKDKAVKRRGRPRLKLSLQGTAVENVLELESYSTHSSIADQMLITDQSEPTECNQLGGAATTCFKNNVAKRKKRRSLVQHNVQSTGLESMSDKVRHHPTSSSFKQVLNAVPSEPTGSTVLAASVPVCLKGDAVERLTPCHRSSLQGILEKGSNEGNHCSRVASADTLQNADPSEPKGCNELVVAKATCLKAKYVKTRRCRPNLKRNVVENEPYVGKHCTESTSADQKVNTYFSEQTQCVALVGTAPTLFMDKAVKKKRGRPRKHPFLQRIEVGKGLGEGNLCTRSSSAEPILMVDTIAPTGCKRLGTAVPTFLNDKTVKRRGRPRLKPSLQGEETKVVNEVINQPKGKIVIDEKQGKVEQAVPVQQKKRGRPPGKKGKMGSVEKQSTEKLEGRNPLYPKQIKTLHVLTWKKNVPPNVLNEVLKRKKEDESNAGKGLSSVTDHSTKGHMGEGEKERRKAAASGNLKANSRILRSRRRKVIEEDQSAQGTTQEDNPVGTLKPLRQRTLKRQIPAGSYELKRNKHLEKSTLLGNLAKAKTSEANRTISTNTKLSDLGKVENKETDCSLSVLSNGQNKDISQCSHFGRFSKRKNYSLAISRNSNLQASLHYSTNDLNNNNCNSDADCIQGAEESLRKQKREEFSNSISGPCKAVEQIQKESKPYFERDDKGKSLNRTLDLPSYSPNQPNKLLRKTKAEWISGKKRSPPKEPIEDDETFVNQKTLLADKEKNPMVLMSTFKHQNEHTGNKDKVSFNTQNGDLEVLAEGLNKNAMMFPDSFQLNLNPENQSTEQMEFYSNRVLNEIDNAEEFFQEAISLLNAGIKGDCFLDSECKNRDTDELFKSFDIPGTKIMAHPKESTNDNQMPKRVLSEGSTSEECSVFSCQRVVPMVGKHIWKGDSCARTCAWPFPEAFLSRWKINMTLPIGYEQHSDAETIETASTFLVKEMEVDFSKSIAGGAEESTIKKRKLDPSLESASSDIWPTASKEENIVVPEDTDDLTIPSVSECSRITNISSNLSQHAQPMHNKDEIFTSGNQSLTLHNTIVMQKSTRKKLGKRKFMDHTAPAAKKPVAIEDSDIIMNTGNVTKCKIPLLKAKRETKTVSSEKTSNQETISRPELVVHLFPVERVETELDQQCSSTTSSPQPFGHVQSSCGLQSYQQKPVDILFNNNPCRTSSLRFWEHVPPDEQSASNECASDETCGMSTSENIVSFECSMSEEIHKAGSLNDAFVQDFTISSPKNNCVPNGKDLTDELTVYEDDVIVLDVIQDDPDLFGCSIGEELKSLTESASTQEELKYFCKKRPAFMPSVGEEAIVDEELSNHENSSADSPIQECEESMSSEMEGSETRLTEPQQLLSLQQPLASSNSSSDTVLQQTSKSPTLPSISNTELERSDPASVAPTNAYLSGSRSLAEGADKSSDEGQLTDDHKLNLSSTDEDVKDETIHVGESEGSTYTRFTHCEDVQESDHVPPRFMPGQYVWEYDHMPPPLKRYAEQDCQPMPPCNNDFSFTDQFPTTSKRPLLPDSCESWKEGMAAHFIQPMMSSQLPAGYCRFYFNRIRGCKRTNCWFRHVPREEDEKLCMDLIQKLVNTDNKLIVHRAVDIFTSYYREVQPGVHYDPRVLDELLISLLKHYMLAEVFHMINIGANVKILPSVEVFLKVFDHVLTNNVIKAVSALINLFCKMVEAGMVLQLEHLDYIEKLVTQLQATKSEINVIVSTKSRLQERQFKTSWLCDLDVAAAEIEHCKEKMDWVKLGTLYINIRMGFENLTDQKMLSNCIGEALIKHSKDSKVVPFCLFADTVKKDPHLNGLDKNLLGRIGVSAMFSYHRSEQWVKGKKVIDKLHEMQINFTVLKGLIGEESEATRCKVVNVAAEILYKNGSLDGAMWVLKESEWVINTSLWTCERMDVLNRHNLLCLIANETLAKSLYRQTFEVLQNLPGLQDNTDAIDVSRYRILFNKLLDSCVENRSLGIASNVADFMVSKKIPINFAVLRALITALGRSCLWLKARAHYKCALKLGCYPPLEGNLYRKMLWIPSYMSEIEMLLAIEMFIVANASSIQSPGGSKQILQIVLKRFNEDLAHSKEEYSTAAERLMNAARLSDPKLLMKHMTVNVTLEQVYILDHCTALKWLDANMKWAGKVWLF